MQYRTLGSSAELTISEIGFGCQSIGGGVFHQDDKASTLALEHALDRGITFFDTADHYSLGRSEQLVGRAFQHKRDRVVIGTKIGTHYTRTGAALMAARPAARLFSSILRPHKWTLNKVRASQRVYDFSPAYLERAVDASLRRLRTDYIDLLQLHKPPDRVLHGEELDCLFDRLQAAGKVRRFGIASDLADDRDIAFGDARFATIQATLNLLAPEQDIIARRGSGAGRIVIARNPLAFGYLAADDRAILGEEYAAHAPAALEYERQASLFQFLSQNDRTLAQAALLFVRSIPGVSVVLPRLLNAQQVNEAVDALECPPLSLDESSAIDSIRKHCVHSIPTYSYRQRLPAK